MSHRRAVLLCALLLLPACFHSAAVAPEPQNTHVDRLQPYEGQVVVAVVERLERNSHTEGLPGERVFVSNVVAFAITAPERADTLLVAHVTGHPRIGDHPLLLGETVRFVLPHNWRNRDLALDELRDLELVTNR